MKGHKHEKEKEKFNKMCDIEDISAAFSIMALKKMLNRRKKYTLKNLKLRDFFLAITNALFLSPSSFLYFST